MAHLNGATNGVHHASDTDADLDLLYSWMPAQQAPQPCPEALFSLTLKGAIGGHEALLTARGQTAEEFRRNLETIKGLLDPVPAKAQASSPPQGQGEGWCAVHAVPMQENHKDGRTWWSHRTDEGSWCKGRRSSRQGA
jgi:hypothetical protein